MSDTQLDIPALSRSISHRNRRAMNHGGPRNRKEGLSRLDKDGDIDMVASGAISKASVGRRSARNASQPLGTARAENSHHELSSRPSRLTADFTARQRDLINNLTSGQSQASHKSTRNVFRKQDLNLMQENDPRLEKNNGLNSSAGLTEIMVRGLKNSKAVSNPDGGVKDLIAFLERKASAAQTIRIRKSRLDGDSLIISVLDDDVSKILRLDHFNFAGATLEVKMYEENVLKQQMTDPIVNDVAIALQAILSRRYSSENRFLDLSNLGTDPDLVSMGIFNTTSRIAKLFPALMKICNDVIGPAHKKVEAVASISLASNALSNIDSVATLAQTFPALKNLDLSNNLFKNLRALEGWRYKFRQLNELVLIGNPIEVEAPNYRQEVLKWYPSLHTLNGNQVRSQGSTKASSNDHALPISILGPLFHDEGNIGETFIRQFFPAYDMDRTALANQYYDSRSTFTLSINVASPKAPTTIDQKAPNWDSYIRRSRNLAKISKPEAKIARQYIGPENILQCWLALPSSRHPSLVTEPDKRKWCIEGHSLPGVPDPSKQSSGGVCGLLIIAHGEFSEINICTGQASNTRSFDRTFVLGPGAGPGGVICLNDTLELRAWGGSDAWSKVAPYPDNGADPSSLHKSPATENPAPAHHQQLIPTPKDFGTLVPGKTAEQALKEQAMMDFSSKTFMTLEWSGMCLEQSNWNHNAALEAFGKVKANLPPEAFVNALRR